jgi:hypothetical protein
MSELRGNIINVIATKDNAPYFMIGDKLQVQSILHNTPKLLVDARCGMFNSNDELIRMVSCDKDMRDLQVREKFMLVKSKYSSHKEGTYVTKMYEPIFAGQGTYNYSHIILADGTEYTDSILGNRTLAYAFDKIN